jgi:hypothetical protein
LNDTAARALGKQRLREVLNLKMQWAREDDQEVRAEKLARMNALMVGTQNLDVVVYSLKFIQILSSHH